MSRSRFPKTVYVVKDEDGNLYLTNPKEMAGFAQNRTVGIYQLAKAGYAKVTVDVVPEKPQPQMPKRTRAIRVRRREEEE